MHVFIAEIIGLASTLHQGMIHALQNIGGQLQMADGLAMAEGDFSACAMLNTVLLLVHWAGVVFLVIFPTIPQSFWTAHICADKSPTKQKRSFCRPCLGQNHEVPF